MRPRFTTQLLKVSITLLLLAASGANAAKYGPGVTDTEIKLGQTMPYSGPLSSFSAIGKAEVAYFQMINGQGGINGRKVNLISLDDGYSPPKTVEQTRKLVERERVLAIFGSLGTPTNSAIHEYLNTKKVPQLFIATNASKWGDPKHFPWTMGYGLSYRTEAKVYAAYILKNLPDAKIGILYQDDDYGKDYVHGLEEGLGEKAAKMIVAELSYRVEDPTVDSQIIELKTSGANVFFNVTSPKFAAQAIRKAYDIGWRPTQFLNSISANINTVFRPAGIEKSIGIITSQSGKGITDPQWYNDQDYKDWVAFMDKYMPGASKDNPSYAIGYAFAFVMTHVLKACGEDLSRENVMRQAANLKDLQVPLLLPGVTANTSPTDYFPIEASVMSRFDGKKLVPFGDVIGK
jgi:branched-chain amino acid transport system substrate-binding protein